VLHALNSGRNRKWITGIQTMVWSISKFVVDNKLIIVLGMSQIYFTCKPYHSVADHANWLECEFNDHFETIFKISK
jgi:hypothetical protein